MKKFTLFLLLSLGIFSSLLIHADEYPIAIVGAGAGGTMAAKRALLNNRKVTLFTGAKKEQKNSRGHWVRTVENIPGLEKYTRAIVQIREEVLNAIATTPFQKNLTLIPESVVSIEKESDLFKLTDSNGKSYLAQYVILATGIMDEQPIIQGSIRPILKYANKQSINYCLMCDGHRSYGKKVAILGHQEGAAQSAIILCDRYQPHTLSLITNGKTPEFQAETLIALKERNISIFEEPIQSILGNGMLQGFELEDHQIVDADIGYVMLGIRPNNKLALMLHAKVDERGLVVTDKNGESSVNNLFVIGDLRSDSMKQIYTAWQHAVDATQAIDRKIRTERE